MKTNIKKRLKVIRSKKEATPKTLPQPSDRGFDFFFLFKNEVKYQNKCRLIINKNALKTLPWPSDRGFDFFIFLKI